ncbi:hypothetical protein Tco_0610579 [Tanacetum coccineum]
MSGSLQNSGIIANFYCRFMSHSISICLLFNGTAPPSPTINFLIQTASIDASAAAMYSAYVEDIAVVLCLALFQSMAPPLSTNTYPVWDLVSSLSV